MPLLQRPKAHLHIGGVQLVHCELVLQLPQQNRQGDDGRLPPPNVAIDDRHNSGAELVCVAALRIGNLLKFANALAGGAALGFGFCVCAMRT